MAVDDEGDGEGDDNGDYHEPCLKIIMRTVPKKSLELLEHSS